MSHDQQKYCNSLPDSTNNEQLFQQASGFSAFVL